MLAGRLSCRGTLGGASHEGQDKENRLAPCGFSFSVGISPCSHFLLNSLTGWLLDRCSICPLCAFHVFPSSLSAASPSSPSSRIFHSLFDFLPLFFDAFVVSAACVSVVLRWRCGRGVLFFLSADRCSDGWTGKVNLVPLSQFIWERVDWLLAGS